MAFTRFSQADFTAMKSVSSESPNKAIEAKIDEIRKELGQYPEFGLDFFRKRIVRRPKMKGKGGLVFGPGRWWDKHWFLYVVGGDQDQVQLNIGMCPDYIRVGMAFQLGRQVVPKIPAFQVFQAFLGVRPPLPFREAFLQCVNRNGFQIEDFPAITDADEIIRHLESHVISADESTVFVFIGKLWKAKEATAKTAEDFRNVFAELLPFYEELILAGGRYAFHL